MSHITRRAAGHAIRAAGPLTLFAYLFLVEALWEPLIDPAITTRDPCTTPQDAAPVALYWYWKDGLLLIALYLIARTQAHSTSPRRRAARMIWAILATTIAVLIPVHFITGNFDTTIAKPAAVAAAIVYTLAIRRWIWNRPPPSAAVEPGAVYLVTRPPRIMLEVLGSWILPKWAGSVDLLITDEEPPRVGGTLYGYSRKSSTFRAQRIDSPPPGRVLTRLDISPQAATLAAEEHIGRPWRWDCFRLVRQILRDARRIDSEK